MNQEAPFLIVYNRPHEVDDGLGHELGRGLPNFFVRSEKRAKNLAQCEDVIDKQLKNIVRKADACLLIELQPIPGREPMPGAGFIEPKFEIDEETTTVTPALLNLITQELATVRVDNDKAAVVKKQGLSLAENKPISGNCELSLYYIRIGLTIPHQIDGQDLPILRREYQTEMYRVLLKIGWHFAKLHTASQPQTPYALARRTIMAPELAADHILDSVGSRCDLLPFVTPTNGSEEFEEFSQSAYEKNPNFLYRPLTVDPYEMFRELYKCPVEDIDDPDIRLLFERTMEEYDIRISMLSDIGTSNFFYNSLRLHGPVPHSLETEAVRILDQIAPRSKQTDQSEGLDALGFAQIAVKEIEKLRNRDSSVASTVNVSRGIQGIMVSNGHLHIASNFHVAENRVASLLAHEVGTHIVTFLNGQMQPFKTLSRGLAGSDELQEALALVAESASGCLPASRIRQLASRVIAVVSLIDGAEFVETFRILHRKYKISPSSAFHTVMRVYRGGGFVKDAMYLSGLAKIARGYLSDIDDCRYLYAGKFGFADAPIIANRLAPRDLITPAKFLPPFLCDPATRDQTWNHYQNLQSVGDFVTD